LLSSLFSPFSTLSRRFPLAYEQCVERERTTFVYRFFVRKLLRRKREEEWRRLYERKGGRDDLGLEGKEVVVQR
jgi:hypothetical protein